MHSRIPPAGYLPPPGDPDGLGAMLTVELASAVAAARRRAARDQDRQLDTAHLLHSLLESDPEVRQVFGPDVVPLLGYLVQRSIGYGLRWQGTVEDSGAIEVLDPAHLPAPGGRGTGAVWSPDAAAAMGVACRRAAGRGERKARGTDLLAALGADGHSRAAEVLRHVGVTLGPAAVSPAERQGYQARRS